MMSTTKRPPSLSSHQTQDNIQLVMLVMQILISLSYNCISFSWRQLSLFSNYIALEMLSDQLNETEHYYLKYLNS